MTLLELILPIFAVIFLGFFLKMAAKVDEAFVQILNQLVYQVFLPVLVFWEISRAPFQGSFNPRLVIITYGAMGFIWLLVLVTGKTLGLRGAITGALAQGSFRGNLAYIGLALAHNLYGSPGLSKAGVLAGFMIPFMNFFSILGTLLKLIILPGFGVLLLRYGLVTGLDFRLTVILLACPTAVVTYIMASELGADKGVSASIIMLSTLISMFTIPVWVWMIGL